MTKENIINNITELKSLNDKRLAKYRRNFRRYNFTPFSTMENIKDGDIVGYIENGYSSTDSSGIPQFNVIKSCIDTLTSKISQSKVRPFFNIVQGSWKDIRLVRNSQEFFDLFYDEQKVYEKVSNVFRDACIFEYGVIYIDEKEKTVNRALPWQVYFRPSEKTYGKLSRAYYERTEYPTCLLEDYKGNNEYCNYALYYDTKNKVKATLIDGKVIKVEKYEKPILPFVFIHYCNPITGNSSQSVVDCLNSIQLQIDKVANKIKEAMDLNPAMSVFVPEGSTIKAGQLNNRVGNIFTYKPIPGMTSSPVTTATPPFIDNQYINMLNDYIQKAYEMVGLTQLSAQGAKPIGIDSGVAIQTLENVESERFEVQLSNVINMFVEIAKTCIFVFDKDDDILPKDKNRCQIKWRDVVKESEKMFIQFSAGDKLGKDPATKAQVIMQWAQAGFIPSSRVASLMEIPDLESTYTLATNSLNAVMTVIDRCIEKDNFDIPDFIPFTLLKEEIINAQLSLYACGKDGSNDEDIEKLNVLYEEVEKIEKEIEPDVEQEVVQDVNNTELTNNVDTDVNTNVGTELTNNIEEN